MKVKYFSSNILGLRMVIFGLYLGFHADGAIYVIATYIGVLFIVLALLGLIDILENSILFMHL